MRKQRTFSTDPPSLYRFDKNTVKIPIESVSEFLDSGKLAFHVGPSVAPFCGLAGRETIRSHWRSQMLAKVGGIEDIPPTPPGRSARSGNMAPTAMCFSRNRIHSASFAMQPLYKSASYAIWNRIRIAIHVNTYPVPIDSAGKTFGGETREMPPLHSPLLR